jgi:hypothetical protein
LAHEPLDLRKAFPFEFPPEEFAAALSQLTQSCEQPIDALFLIELRHWVGGWIGQRQVIDRCLIILASAERLAMGVQHLEAQDLKGQRNQFGQFGHVGVFVVQDDENILREILREVPRYT